MGGGGKEQTEPEKGREPARGVKRKPAAAALRQVLGVYGLPGEVARYSPRVNEREVRPSGGWRAVEALEFRTCAAWAQGALGEEAYG